MSALGGRLPVFSPLGYRAFRLLWIGMSVSLLGDGVFLVALAWHVYTNSGAPSAMAAVGVAMSAPQVATLLVGGVLTDRLPRRRVLLGSDAVRFAALAALTAVAALGLRMLWPVWVTVAVYGAATGFFGPAFDAIVPDLVPDRELERANALDQIVRPLALRIAGPALGGVLVATLGTTAAFGLDAASFLVSVTAIRAIRAAHPPPAPVDGSTARQLTEGLRYIRRHSWLWATFLAAALAYLLFVGPTEVLLPYVIKTVWHGNAVDLGLVLTCGGAGAVLGAAVVGWRGVPTSFIRFMYGTWALATLAVAGYGLATATWQLAVTCLAVNALEAAGTVAWATAKHRHVPATLLGRVSSLDWFISIALVPLSFAAVAPLTDLLGARTVLVAAGTIGAAVTWAVIYIPGVRAPEKANTPQPTDVPGTQVTEAA